MKKMMMMMMMKVVAESHKEGKGAGGVASCRWGKLEEEGGGREGGRGGRGRRV